MKPFAIKEKAIKYDYEFKATNTELSSLQRTRRTR